MLLHNDNWSVPTSNTWFVLRAVGKARDTHVVVQSKKHSTFSRLITKGHLLVKGKKGDYILLLVLRIVPFFVLPCACNLCCFQLQVVPLATGPTLSLKQSTYLITFLAVLTTPVLRTTRFANYKFDLTDEKNVI